MKKLLYLPLIAAISFSLFSCQKEADGGPEIPTIHKVKTYTEEMISDVLGDETLTLNLGYDANNRITSLTSATNPNDRFVFTYKSGSFSMDLYNDNIHELHEDFLLNADNLIDSTFQYNSTGDSSTSKHFYNGSKQMIKALDYEYSVLTGSQLENTTICTYDATGNLIRTVDSYNNEEIYEYYPDQAKVLPVIFPHISAEKLKLVKKYTVKSGGTLIGSADYTYTFDSEGRISTQKIIDTGGTQVTKTFTYF